MGCGSAKISQKDDSGGRAAGASSPHGATAGGGSWSQTNRSSSYHFSMGAAGRRDPDFRRQRFAATTSASVSSGVSNASRRSDFSVHSATTVSGTSRIRVTLSEDGSMLEIQTETFYPDPASDTDPTPSTSYSGGGRRLVPRRARVDETIHSSLIDLKQYERDHNVMSKTQLLKARSRKSDGVVPLRKIKSGIDVKAGAAGGSGSRGDPPADHDIAGASHVSCESLKARCLPRPARDNPSPVSEVISFCPAQPTSRLRAMGCRVKASASDFAIASRPKGGRTAALPPRGSSRSFDCVTDPSIVESLPILLRRPQGCVCVNKDFFNG